MSLRPTRFAAGSRVEVQVADVKHSGALDRAASAESAQPCQQVGEGEGLGQVVVVGGHGAGGVPACPYPTGVPGPESTAGGPSAGSSKVITGAGRERVTVSWPPSA